MPSDRTDRPEHSFQSEILVTEIDTDCAPDDRRWVPLAPGESHTLEEEMLTFFVTRGSLIYSDVQGHHVGYEDVFTRLQQARDHLEVAGLDKAILDAMIR